METYTAAVIEGARYGRIKRTDVLDRARAAIAENLGSSEVPFGYDSWSDYRETQRRTYPELFEGEDAVTFPAEAVPAPTEKQIAFIARLAAERGVEVPVTPTRELASFAIDTLLALPKKPSAPKATPAPAVTDGMYRTADGAIYKVQRAVNGSGNLYAKRLERATVTGPVFGTVDQGRWTFVYAPGAVRRLRPEDKMTLEQAKEFGALYGTCCVCGRTLTDEQSIAAGIGPICQGKEWG